MAKAHIPALTLGIVENGKLSRVGAYGLADLELVVPVKADTIFEITGRKPLTDRNLSAMLLASITARRLDTCLGHF